jgi:hypothetical protein
VSEPHVDTLGHAIKVGDFVVYGALAGRCAVLKLGWVKELRYSDPATKNFPKVSCVTVEKTWNRGWALQKKGSPVSFAVAQVVVLRPDMIPSEAGILLTSTP